MFETFDNTGFIRINFHSDDLHASEINKRARDKGVPIVCSPSTMGGYRFPVLEELAGTRHYQILKSGLPENGSETETLQLQSAINDVNTVYSYVDSGNVTIVQIQDWASGIDSLNEHGWSILSDRKTFKRIKTCNRPFRTFLVTDEVLRVHIVEDEDYTELDTDLYDEETLERLLDGAFVIAPWIRDACMQNVSFPVATEQNDNYSVDDFRKKMFVRQSKDVVAWNARFFGKMKFTGISEHDPLHDRPGMLKGEAFVHTSDICEKMKVDVIATRSAFKKEVSCSGKTYLLLEAQSPKFDGVMSDLQSMINLPALFDPDFVRKSTAHYLLKAFVDLTNNELMDYWYQMTSPLFNRDTAAYDLQDVSTLTKWNARAWVMSGLPVTYSPWLFEQLAGSIISPLRPQDDKKMRFPVICAIRCQVISQSFASMCGEDIEIEPGQARFVHKLESVVVNDQDWLEMYRSHGGQDLDDFFICYYRTIGEARKIILARSPNDIGEYSIMDYVEGDYNPSFTTNSKQVVTFPKVSDDPALWCKRLSETYEDGLVSYKGLPSENQTVDKSGFAEPKNYSRKDVFEAVENNRSSQACVGANVNARGLWALTTRTIRPRQLTTMEGCIDAGAQGGSAADTEAVMKEAKHIVQQVIKETDGVIDAYLWNSRFAAIHKYPFSSSRISTEGYITKNDTFRKEYVKKFMEMAREWAQMNCVNKLDPVIHQLGILRSKAAYELLIASRAFVYHSQKSGPANLLQQDWKGINGPIKGAFDMQETPFAKHNLAIALLSVCHKVPTASSGKFSDQIIMNPECFPYIMDAMRFYGIAAYLDITPEGRIQRRWVNEWELSCKNCNASRVTKDPKILQAYHLNDQLCKSCR